MKSWRQFYSILWAESFVKFDSTLSVTSEMTISFCKKMGKKIINCFLSDTLKVHVITFKVTSNTLICQWNCNRSILFLTVLRRFDVITRNTGCGGFRLLFENTITYFGTNLQYLQSKVKKKKEFSAQNCFCTVENYNSIFETLSWTNKQNRD